MDSDSMWMLKLSITRTFGPPLEEEGTVTAKGLNAMITSLTHKDEVSGGMHRQTSEIVELAVARTFRAPFSDESPFHCKDLNTVIAEICDVDEVLCGMSSILRPSKDSILRPSKDCYATRVIELTVSSTVRTPFSNKGSIDIKHLNSTIPAVGDKDPCEMTLIL